METVGEERVRAAKSLDLLEDASLLLEKASQERNPQTISPSFAQKIAGILNALTTVNSRDDAERLLATGVTVWNSILALEDRTGNDKTAIETLIKIRHVAADCMHIAVGVLGGISARFDIDEVALFKFYTICGQKYASELSNMELAQLCYQKALEFHDAATEIAKESKQGSKTLSRSIFDLHLGRAECAWENGDTEAAERLVSEARKCLTEVPEECEYLASVEYNFGLFMYKAKKTERALKWLQRSFDTRGDSRNVNRDLAKQAKTARLVGVCMLALRRYDEAKDMMEKAETISHDAVGAYLLLKLAVVTRSEEASSLLESIVEDRHASLDICMASIALMGDAQRLPEALKGYQQAFRRFADDRVAATSTIGPKYFEVLISLGKTEDALRVLNECCKLIEGPFDNRGARNMQPTDTEESDRLRCWSILALSSGTALADRKDFGSAAAILEKALSIARTLERIADSNENTETEKGDIENVVLANEAAVCRLVSSCALCAASNQGNLSTTQKSNVVLAHCMTFDPLPVAEIHAKRAKQLDPDDFACRLLLFRAYLLQNRPAIAAEEMRKASRDIPSFDAGALAEAACTARDVGSKESVIAALQCIIGMSGPSLRKSIMESEKGPLIGFFGSALIGAVSIIMESRKPEHGLEVRGETPNESNYSGIGKKPFDVDAANLDSLIKILKKGWTGITELGIDVAFESEDGRAESSLCYLADVAWNAGRRAGELKLSLQLSSCFDMCYEFNKLRRSSTDVVNTMRVARIMSAMAVIDNGCNDFTQVAFAREKLADARKLFDTPPYNGDAFDPMCQVLVTLEAKCFASTSDEDALACLVESCCIDSKTAPGVLEHLAAICLDDKTGRNQAGGELKACRNQLACALLESAVDRRLLVDNPDMKAISQTLRELLVHELARGETGSRAYHALAKAVGLIQEKGDAYPIVERRWMAATAWDKAEMLARSGQKHEALRWAESARTVASSDCALSTYVSRIAAFIESLPQITK